MSSEKTEITEYGLVNVDELTRAKDHETTFPYTDTTEFEGTNDSYKKFKRIFPVVYVIMNINDVPVKVVVDGWKYVVFARANGISEIYACELTVENQEDLIAIMIQLQRTNHQSYLALYYMIEALWEKHYLGKGYRSDLQENELDNPVEGADGKKETIYDRIGRELNLKPHKVKYLRKIGQVNKRQFIQMDSERPSLYKLYKACVSEQSGDAPALPAYKTPVYHSNATPVPVFTTPTPEANVVTHTSNSTGTNKVHADSDQASSTKRETPIGGIIKQDGDCITVQAICQCCSNPTFLIISKSQLL
ncbi:MAG: hypothetical protein IPP77_05955 [Bacteroidetes bacterium]|nr:hypothetical protein [Bacteroidota bacterium]